MRFLTPRRGRAAAPPAAGPVPAGPETAEPVLELTRDDLVPAEGGADGPGTADLSALSAEIGVIGEYVARLRREIAAVRPNETADTILPSLRGELDAIGSETSRATDAIMSAAEALLKGDAASPEETRVRIADRTTEILEACSFQDLAGQRLDRAVATLRMLEERMRRFKDGTALPDAGVFDRAAIVRDVRRDVLLVDGPARSGDSVDQHEVDRLFG